MTFGDRDASFGVQVVAQHRRGYVTDLMVPLDLSYKLPKSVSERFGFTVEDEMLSPAKEQRIMNVGRRHRNKATGLTMPDATGQPIFARDSAAAHAPAFPAAFFQATKKALDLRGVSRSSRMRRRRRSTRRPAQARSSTRWIGSTLLSPAAGGLPRMASASPCSSSTRQLTA
jgi:hypothetical protein